MVIANRRQPPDREPDTRERILQAAAEAWHESSFDGVGVAELCRRARIHKGSFFHFFASKDDLLLAVLDRYAEQVRVRLTEGPFRRDVPPLQRVRRFFAGILESVRGEVDRIGCTRGCPIGNVASELATRSPAVRAATARVFDVMRAVFADALREAVATGELDEDVDAEAAAGAVLAYLQGLAVLGKAYGDVAQLERLGGRVMGLISASARGDAATRPDRTVRAIAGAGGRTAVRAAPARKSRRNPHR